MKSKLTGNRAWGMTAKKSLLQVAFLLLLGFCAFAQVSIHGKILDEKGNPLSGATVQVKGTNQFTQTDQNGDFSLNAPSSSSRLVFSFTGYTPKEITVGNHSNVNVTLDPANATMGEVVVVGYGTQKKSDLTGAISSVSAKDLAKATPVNATEALQGRAAGVQVTTNSGAPGTEGTIRIRGIGTVNNNDPLFVVDGMFVSSINYLNPSDIARIEVLKDASATAIYGSRGANGVVLITTQKGSIGKPIITFNANTSISKVTNLAKTLNRDQYLDYLKTAYLNGYLRSVANANPNEDPFTSTDPFFNYTKNTLKPWYDKGYYTNWADSLFKTAVVQSYDIGIRGGASNVRYAASAGYFDQKGILENSEYKRYTFRLNTEYTVNKRLVIGENLSVAHSNTLGGGAYGYAGSASNGIINGILSADPLTPIINPNANPNDPDYQYNKYMYSVVQNAGTPAAAIARINDRSNLLKLVGNVYGELELIKGLKLRTSLGYDYQTIDSSGFSPKYFIATNDQNPTSTVAQGNSNFFGQVWENTLNYNTKIADHSITGLLGYTEELYKGKFTNATRTGTANNDPSLQVLNAATGAITLTGNKTNFALRSYFARINYSYADKYLLTATVRRDGSSKFATGKQWGTFPSVSTGWRISNEKFFQNLKALSFISSLKLRAGWGQIGNQSMPGGTNNPYLSLVEGTNGYRYIFGDALANGNYLTSLGTPAISWETSQQTNIGIDLSLFGLYKNALTFSADYFVKNTKNMLLSVPLPSYTGFPSIPYTNAGNIQNKGFEIVVAYQGKAGSFTYGMSANASHFITKAVSLGAGNKPIVYNDPYTQLNINRTQVGRSVGEFYGYLTDGIFQNTAEVQGYNKNGTMIQPNALPGDFRFKDLNGDGVIDANDQTWIGNPLPKLLYGYNLNLGYKNFDVAVLFQGSYGNKLVNVNKKYRRILTGGGFGADLIAYEAAWRGEGTSNTQPIISTINKNDNFRVSDWYVEDGSYLRLKNLQIGYNISPSWFKRAGISGSRIWIGGTDLFTITKYTGNDPEAGLSANPLMAGREFSAYPKMKRYSLGVNLTF
jgi:TonB-linked SusC/RagA family outer membrane protein